MGINSLKDFMAYMAGGTSLLMDAKITGSCLCENVKYELIGCPTMRVVCHCTNCQKASGSSFMANSFFKKEHFTILTGQDSIRVFYDDKTRDGVTLERHFCSNCGSPLFVLNPENPQTKDGVVVTTGTMDVDHQVFEMSSWQPDVELFIESKRAWLPGDLVKAGKK